MNTGIELDALGMQSQSEFSLLPSGLDMSQLEQEELASRESLEDSQSFTAYFWQKEESRDSFILGRL